MPARTIPVVVTIGLAVFTSRPAFPVDARGMTCAEIAAFAQEVAQQKTEGHSLGELVRRLRRSFGRGEADTEHELEKIVRGIYGMQIFVPATPEEIGIAYENACEGG